MKMSPLVYSLIIAVLATGLMLLVKSKSNPESNASYGCKVFFIVMLTVFIMHSYVMGESGSGQEFDVGEPPF